MADTDFPNLQAPGQQKMQFMLDGGVPQIEIDKWRAGVEETFSKGGVPKEEVDKFWGVPTGARMDKVAATIKANQSLAPPTETKGYYDAFLSGYQTSVAGLATGGPPTKILPQDAGSIEKILNATGQMVPDLPIMIAGFAMGAPAGAAGGAVVGGPVGAAAGALAGGGAVGNALPELFRDILMDQYAHPEGYKTPKDFLDRASAIAIQTGKAGLIGAVATLAGGAVGSRVAGGTGSAAGGTAANIVTQAAAGATVGSALEGRMPTADDFTTAAVTMLGLHAAGVVVTRTVNGVRASPSPTAEQMAENLRDIYRKNGVRPGDAVRQAIVDPAALSEVLAPRAPDGTVHTPTLDAVKPDEMQPHNPEKPLPPLPPAEKPAPPPRAEGAPPPDPALQRSIYVTGQDGSAHALTQAEAGEFYSIKDFKEQQAFLKDKPAPERVPHQEGIDQHNDRDTPKASTLAPAEKPAEPTADHANRVYRARPEDVTDADSMMVRTLEGNASGHADHAVSIVHGQPGAIGRHQIMPGTARDYGFDPSRLQDVDYNTKVFRAIWSDLSRKFDGNLVDMLVAYNAGPGRARSWVAGGRKLGDLPAETQKYIGNAEKKGFLKGDYLTIEQTRASARAQGDPGDWVPTATGAGEGGGGGREPPRIPPPDDLGPQGGPRQIEDGRPKFTEDAPKLTDEHLLDTMSDIIGKPKEDPSVWDPQQMLAAVQRELMPAARLDRSLDEALGKRPEGVMRAEDLLRQTFASGQRAAYMLMNGTLRPGETGYKEVGQDSFRGAFRQAKKDKGTTKGFMEYLIAGRTANDLAKRGIKSGADLTRAQEIVSRPSIRAKYERARSIWNGFTDGVVDYGHHSGLFSRESARRLKDSGTSYVTLRRIFDPDFNKGRPGSRFKVGRPTRDIKGSTKEVLNPISATIDNTHTIVAMADRNIAVGRILSRVEQYQRRFPDVEPPFAKDEAAAKSFVVKDENGKILNAEVTDDQGHPIDANSEPAFEPFIAEREMRAGRLGPNQFIYWNDGKMEVWTAKDPQMARLMRGPVMQENTFISAMFDGVARWARVMISSSPSFITGATIHGQLATAAWAEGGRMLPFMDMLHGFMKSSFTLDGGKPGLKGEAYDRAMANGALVKAFDDVAKKHFVDRLEQVYDETSTTQNVYNVFRHPFEALMAAHDMLSSASRIGAMERLENKGLSTLKAATLSRTAYLDHNEGRSLQALNFFARKVPFMEIGWKDWGQVKDAFLRNAPKAGMAAFSLFFAPTMVLYAVNALRDASLPENDPTRYDQINDEMRYRYFHIPFNGDWFRIPKPYVGGWFFSTLPELVMDDMFRQDKPGFKVWAHTFLDRAMIPYVPTLLAPPVEWATGTNLHTWRSMIPAAVEKRSNYLQYTPYTTETAKAISRVIHMAFPDAGTIASPIMLEEFAAQYSGGVLMQILRAAELPFKPPGPPSTFLDNPFVKSFFSRTGTNAHSITMLYEYIDDFERKHGDLQMALKSGDMSLVEKQQIIQGSQSVQQYKSTLHNMRATLDTFYRSKATNEEKLKMTDVVASQMIAYSRGVVQMLRATEAAAKR